MQSEIDKLKIRANEIFTPDLFKWIIVSNRTYDKRRLVSGYGGMADLPAVDEDARCVREGIKRLGALDDDIILIENCDFTRLKDLFADLNRQAVVNQVTHRKKTFFFLYYAGHATLDSTTKVVLNEGRIPRFPIESMLRTLGTHKGAYVLGVLDCCRKPISDE